VEKKKRRASSRGGGASNQKRGGKACLSTSVEVEKQAAGTCEGSYTWGKATALPKRRAIGVRENVKSQSGHDDHKGVNRPIGPARKASEGDGSVEGKNGQGGKIKG